MNPPDEPLDPTVPTAQGYDRRRLPVIPLTAPPQAC
jgi:hypothetical protein